MKIVVRYFAHLRRTLDRKEEILVLPEGAKVSDLLAVVQERCRGNLDLARYQVTKRGEAIDAGEELLDGDTIYIFPPVGGGVFQKRLY